MPDIVNDVENALYNRMLRNAFKGFIKSGLIAAVAGAVLGALLFDCGVLSPLLLSDGMLETCLGSLTLAGAMVGAAAFMLPARPDAGNAR